MVNLAKTEYIGRFAPSPTGPLHLGSLYAALASFLDAKANQGKWLLRIDDSDTFRNVATASSHILSTLENHGLLWDDSIVYQSDCVATYQKVINTLVEQQLSYPCICTRKTLAALNTPVYPGFCLTTQVDKQRPFALRIKSRAIEINFNDQIQGQQSKNIAQQYGDFIIRRKDNIIAYQLAVVIDDYLQNINHVIRGFDLLDSTPKQLYLQKTLGYPSPTYGHIPVIIDQQGDKLSKQTFAQAVSSEKPEKTLFFLLKLLQQSPPNQLAKASVNEMIEWAITHWQPRQLQKMSAINQRID